MNLGPLDRTVLELTFPCFVASDVRPIIEATVESLAPRNLRAANFEFFSKLWTRVQLLNVELVMWTLFRLLRKGKVEVGALLLAAKIS
jgi:hypothetical protein